MDENLSGAEIVTRLRMGHMVRREAWVDGVFIRICNEAGFDENGFAIPQMYKGRQIAMYTKCTNDYFLHFASSSQPCKEPYVYQGSYSIVETSSRDGEGINMMFEEDWEDHGFISTDDFDKLTEETKDKVWEDIREAKNRAIENFRNNTPNRSRPCVE